MKIYAISDLHLSTVDNKAMDIFGDNWYLHWEKIKSSWQELVSKDDLVLLPGDLSWAMKAVDALPDINSVSEMPGKKLILRGNHDYWWQSYSKVCQMLPEHMYALQNNSFEIGGMSICGSRGWTCPSGYNYSEEDGKIYKREIARLELSLKSAKCIPEVCMMHYPPFNEKREPSGFTKLFSDYGVRLVVYGHLHGKTLDKAFCGVIDRVFYQPVSCDYLNFSLLQVHSFD